jgi:glutamate synthase domain-containing protein 3
MDRVMRFDLARQSVREVNQFLHHELAGSDLKRIEILHPEGAHSIAAGMDADVEVAILGHAGYYTAGMNQRASVVVEGNTGWSVAENIMSGRVHVKGHASQCAGASGHGGLLVIDGDASSRCGISLKGAEIVVGGSVGHFTAFMAQAGTIAICGDAGANLGDSLYEAVIYVRGSIESLGADARQEDMGDQDVARLRTLLAAASREDNPEQFKRVASAKTLYHWNAEHYQEY